MLVGARESWEVFWQGFVVASSVDDLPAGNVLAYKLSGPVCLYSQIASITIW